MKKEISVNTKTSTRAASFAIAGVLSVGAFGCDQPAPKCNVAQSLSTGGNFAATFTLEDGSKEGEGDCDTLIGDTLYFGSFYAENKDHTPNYNKVSVGVAPTELLNILGAAAGTQAANPDNAYVTPNPDDKSYAYGGFDSSEPESDDFCYLTEMDPARVRIPAVKEYETADPNDPTGMTIITVPAAEAIDVTYEFSNVQVYMTVGSPGRQVAADLTYTKNKCTAKYKVAALFPQTWCSEVDATGTPTGVPNDKLCTENPAFVDDAVRCDPMLLLCVLKHDVPSLK
jgi:hypothetical protein